MANVRELSISYNCESRGGQQYDAVLPFLNLLENLVALELCSKSVEDQLSFLRQDYVHESLRTLRILDFARPLQFSNAWNALPRQFPKLRALHLEQKHDGSHLRGGIDSSFPISASFKRFRNLESIVIMGYNVPLTAALNLCVPARIKSVVCQSVFKEAVAVTDAQSKRIAKLRRKPGCRVEFHLSNKPRSPRSPPKGGFRFAFSRSQ
jgi:hypothetical protein